MAIIQVTAGEGISSIYWERYKNGSQTASGSISAWDSASWWDSSGYIRIYPNARSGYTYPIYFTRTDGYRQTIKDSDGDWYDPVISFSSNNKMGTVTASEEPEPPPPPTYTIRYDANGGTGAPSQQTKTHGVTLTLSSVIPTRANSSAGSYTVTLNANGGSVSPSILTAARTTSYSFSEWNTDNEGDGTSYSPGGSYTANASATLYAQWTSSTSTASVTLPTPSRTGYNFLGWGESSTSTSGITGSYTPTKNIILYAVWSIKTYTIRYNANGGTNAPDPQTKTHGVAITLRDGIPYRTGYNFKWWTDYSDTYSPGQTYTVDGDNTLYAVWEIKTYTISYNANGGTRAPSPQTKTHGVPLTLSEDIPIRTGYNFKWWTDYSDTYSPGQSYTVEGNNTLYAEWEAKTYTITYNTNGGKFDDETTTKTQTKTHGIDITLLTDVPKKDKYRFLYWTDYSDNYSPGQTYSAEGNSTLYAQWSHILCDLFYWHGSDAADAEKFAVGEPVSDALTATAWNSMIDKISELRGLLGQSPSSVSKVSTGDKITATTFNHLRTAVRLTEGAGTVPSAARVGDTIKTSLFNGTGSLKDALNTAINAYNNS